MNEKTPDLPPAALELRKTRLRVEEGELVRRNELGGAVMQVPLDDIESIIYSREISMFAIVMIVMAGGFASIGYFVSNYNVLNVILYVLAMLLCSFGVFGFRDDVIVLRTRGENFRITPPDQTDDVVGFVVSVKRLCGDKNDLA